MTPVRELRPFPSIVTLNMEAVSSCHTVNHPPHYIVSQPTAPRCKCTWLQNCYNKIMPCPMTTGERSWMS